MNVLKDKMVSVTYELKYDDADAQLIEKVESDNPLSFLFGSGNMLEHFEKNLEGLATGDEFDFKLSADHAYGPVTEQAVVNVPQAAFEVDGKVDEKLLTVGNTIPMMDSYGNKLHGIVLEILESDVRMDFNHPLAGEDLHFKGKVVEVRDAKAEELASCCSSGSCGDGSDGGGCGDGGCGGC